MSAQMEISEEEDMNLYHAKKMLQLLSDLSSPVVCNNATVDIDREGLSIFAQVINDLIPKRFGG